MNTQTPAPGLRHREDCPREAVQRVRGTHGDTLDRCSGCGRFVVVGVPARPDPSSSWRYVIPCAGCGRELRHPDHRPAVRWCRSCAGTPRRRPRPEGIPWTT